MTRWSWLILYAGLAAAGPVVVFEDDPTPGDARCEVARLLFGRDAAGGYATVPAAEAAGYGVLPSGGGVPVAAEAPLGGRGDYLRVQAGERAGWWRLELPVRPEPGAVRGELADGRLVLALRGQHGGEAVDVGLADAGAPRHSVRLPLSRYGAIETAWTIFSIPLDHFLNLAPELKVERLEAVLLFSSRPGPLQLDIDHVQLVPGRGDRAPLRVVVPAESAAPPAAGIPPKPPDMAAPAETATPAAPSQPAQAGPAPPSVPDPMAAAPAEPATPAVAPKPAEPATPQPAEPTPAEPVAPKPEEPKPVEPATPGPAPAAPAPAGPPPAPAEDLRPTVTVAEFFSEAPAGQKVCDGAQMQASWATNQGERAFDAAELKENFTLGAGEALPLVASQDPARPGSVLLVQVRKPGFAWWTVRLAPAGGKPVSLLPYLRNGRLELAVRGEMGGEVIRVGLADTSDPPKPALLALDRVAKVTTTWQVFRIPLRALRAMVPDLDFEHITALWLTSASGRPLTLYLDDLRIVNPVADGGR